MAHATTSTSDTRFKSFRTSVECVLQEANNTKELRKSSSAKLLQFAIDTCLVAHGIRTGYLVDAVWSPEPARTFSSILRSLCKESSTFANIALWYHDPSAQSFFVNISLVREKLNALKAGTDRTVFVRLGEILSVSNNAPGALVEALSVVHASLDQSSFTLPDTLTQEALVPLAAILIDYPVAYVPASSGQTSFLAREPLDVYEVSFKAKSSTDCVANTIIGDREWVLLKFSCPQVLASEHPELLPAMLTEKLYAQSESCLSGIGMCMSVVHRVETLDRVAL
ncbi:hypothetical protein HYDPIDRAFT_30241 [Hydnomerulius pinastri MD-312]|uniref:Uncharacterized protein n=1 Tax=Hydnomerulius pinastri MD-312 TaxID=994086 RepID=A0A0C9VAE9_9AGAM|nr:hypothetical protein HYDPIDRAFT_30241 [Hydnomerulius pinastri MD-312]